MTDWPTQPIPAIGRPAELTASQVPGSAVAGRYRLLVCHGISGVLEFWQAVDVAAGRAVALTLVDPHSTLPVEWVNEILSLTVRLRGVDAPGIATILDVFHTGQCGVVVADWVAGGSLREVADTDPSPVAAAAALETLAMAAETAHRAGMHLSLDHPARIRVSSEGHAVLAFPATLADGTPQRDLRGIGACLYALLAKCWPGDVATPGFAALQRDSAGQPVELAQLRPGTPFLVSTTAAGLVRPEPGITSAATLSTMLRQAARDGRADDADIRVLPPLEPPPPGVYAAFRNFGPEDQKQEARKGILRATIGAAAAVVTVGVVMLGSNVNEMLQAPQESAAMDPDQLGLQNDPTPVAPVPKAPEETTKAAAADAPVKPVKAEVFSTDGRPDNPDDAGRVIDGDASTAWSTDRYYDADPFPKFKEGLGLMLELPAPTTLGSVTVDLGSTGTVVQVRSAASQTPSALGDTREISAPTPMQPGRNTIAVRSREPVKHVLVWVSTLGQTDGNSQGAISEITLLPPAPPA
ncbi:protein kinase family protein [Mycobacterium sp. IS-1742]|uniref:protein kinase family protein n=1 Tax=Mycobacterium sp. IS-1742 TaxID=1772285 RepID=UPI0018D26353|nr:protein kinase family protein [Mycobacterium sp. IS-1742]